MIIRNEDLKDYQLISKSPKESRILLFITIEEKEALKSLSCSSGVSMNEIMRRAMYNAINTSN